MRAQQWSFELDILKEIRIPRSLSDSKDERSSSAHPFGCLKQCLWGSKLSEMHLR